MRAWIYNFADGPKPSQRRTKIGFADFDELDRVIMHAYDTSRVWSSFLPGIGGEWGIPTWGFYVNRGQGMVTIGGSLGLVSEFVLVHAPSSAREL